VLYARATGGRVRMTFFRPLFFHCRLLFFLILYISLQTTIHPRKMNKYMPNYAKVDSTCQDGLFALLLQKRKNSEREISSLEQFAATACFELCLVQIALGYLIFSSVSFTPGGYLSASR
jgi:hypothetical protein